MATKQPKIILKDSINCVNTIQHNNDIYCKIKMKDDSIYAESAKVIKCDCIWYDERKIKNAK